VESTQEVGPEFADFAEKKEFDMIHLKGEFQNNERVASEFTEHGRPGEKPPWCTMCTIEIPEAIDLQMIENECIEFGTKIEAHCGYQNESMGEAKVRAQYTWLEWDREASCGELDPITREGGLPKWRATRWGTSPCARCLRVSSACCASSASQHEEVVVGEADVGVLACPSELDC
jgi:hypothetical protein